MARHMKKLYDIDEKKPLGSGSYGKVFRATNKEDKEHVIAIKVIKKVGMTDRDLMGLQREVSIMNSIDHPNIVKYYETYNDHKFIYLCMELCTGGELFKKIEQENKINESIAAKYMIKLVSALQHCHSQGIVHRDIKPDNIMLDSRGEVKFIDFGFAVVKQKKQNLHDIAGTPYYVAPEVLDRDYGKECDIWSLGVCLYHMLSGSVPFLGKDQQEVFEKIKSGEYPDIGHISSECRDLLSKMIMLDVKKRITAA